MRRIEVLAPDLNAGAYTVQVGSGALDFIQLPERQVALLHPEDLPERWVRAVQDRLNPCVTVRVPARDGCKALDVYAGVLNELARVNLPRDGAVVGLGGGAVTDLAGFVAASWLRGVTFYTLPTTLLGMVDAAVGGKTGLNLSAGKNLVGAFWSPRAVWCDTATLSTLLPRVFREGAAEVFKHGLIAQPSLLTRVLAPAFRPGGPGLADVVADAVAVKAGLVARDPREAGERAFLNFGHTLAHAIEAATDHAVPHGEAVGFGMHFAARVSRAVGGADLTGFTRDFLAWQRPAPFPTLDFEVLNTFMARDKKADSEGVRFVLLHALARPYLARVPPDVLEREFNGWAADVSALALGSA